MDYEGKRNKGGAGLYLLDREAIHGAKANSVEQAFLVFPINPSGGFA
jgi:hypothetical protein